MTDEPKRKRTRKPKTRSGCSVCKRRIKRVKCDEQLPSCRRCISIGVECPGYFKPVKWSTKYEQNITTSLDFLENSTSWFDTEARRLSNMIQSRSDSVGNGQSDTDSCCAAVPAVSPLCSAAIASCSSSFVPPEVTEEIPETQSPSPSLQESGSSSYEDSQTEEEPLLEPDPPNDNTLSLTYYMPAPQSSLILNHYFSTVCLVNSAFDSSYNPFRSEVSRLMVDSPLLFGCVLSMSAAHLYQGDQSSSSIPLQFQTEALSHLSDKLSQITDLPPTRKASGNEDDPATTLVAKEKTLDVPDDVLLAIILLGMTAAWHDVSATGLLHLHGSRQLFKSWVSSNNLRDHKKRAAMSKTQTFLLSSMIYWEAMSSILLDQEYEALSYLDIFCDPNPPSLIHPCPWTGVGTPVFVFLAKAATLVRNNRALRSLKVFKTGEVHRSALYSELLGKAADLEGEILRFRLPFVGLIDDIGDPCTPPDHFLAVSRCYRLAALLELYSAFPETIKTQAVLEQAIDVPAGECDDQTYLLLGLAFAVGLDDCWECAGPCHAEPVAKHYLETSVTTPGDNTLEIFCSTAYSQCICRCRVAPGW
ncbi:hypothetical protein FSARC_1510 [Fusarium sarcochroum]|uniref:Zn(2)-C6 fungal-type domain-containing protein n=1 Tax=Fusarium sarcochroum TaxID=1208366 RepID=A0A8H4U8H6_9HYPO|nr:hypothetical protein FSARC_1510 [Fusarium sarcochroum]